MNHWISTYKLGKTIPQLPVRTTYHRLWLLSHRLSTSRLGMATWPTSATQLN